MFSLINLFKKPFSKTIIKDSHGTDKKSSQKYDTSAIDDTAAKDISAELNISKDYMIRYFNNSSDIVVNEFEMSSGIKVLVVYIDGLVNIDVLNRDVIHSFITMDEAFDIKSIVKSPEKIRNIISAVEVGVQYTYTKAANEIFTGNSAVFIDGMKAALIISAKGFSKREIAEPNNETSIKGPRESFVENLRTNTSMLRRKMKNKNLIIEKLHLGKQTSTEVEIAYISGIAKKEVIDEVKNRLNIINTDSILGSGYIEQYIEDNKFSLFPTMFYSQKPDSVAAHILEGRVAILCNGTPDVITVPTLFIEYFQVTEDYYNRPVYASIARIIRFTCFMITILLPAFYVALQTYHQEMIPTVLLVKMAGAMSGIPFPTLIETLVMMFFYEVLREASTRLPRVIGSAISIVGALVLGESAVNAGIVSAVIVIVVALTAICSFANPGLIQSAIIIRFIFVILAGALGLFGVTCGVFAVIIHISSMQSFGSDYTYPIAPFSIEGMKDFLIRFPLWTMKKRPSDIAGDNKTRQGRMR